MTAPDVRLSLRPLALADGDVARRAHDELAAEGSSFLVEPVGDLEWEAYVDRIRAIEDGRASGRWESVAEVFRVAVVGDEVVGRVAIKPTLTPWLAEVGGHIGYAVRPGHRRRGHEACGSSLVETRWVEDEQIWLRRYAVPTA